MIYLRMCIGALVVAIMLLLSLESKHPPTSSAPYLVGKTRCEGERISSLTCVQYFNEKPQPKDMMIVASIGMDLHGSVEFFSDDSFSVKNATLISVEHHSIHNGHGTHAEVYVWIEDPYKPVTFIVKPGQTDRAEHVVITEYRYANVKGVDSTVSIPRE